VTFLPPDALTTDDDNAALAYLAAYFALPGLVQP